PRLLPEHAPRGLRLRRPRPPPRPAPPGDAARRAPRAVARLPADPRLDGVEARGAGGADPAHPAAPRRDHRPAVLPALDHDAAPAGVVLAPLPERGALPALRALEPRLALRARRLPDALRAGLRPEDDGLGVVLRLRRLRRAVRNHCFVFPERFASGRREKGGAGKNFPRKADPVALPRRDGLGDAARGVEPHHAEHRERALPLGAAARALPRELHPRLRPSALVRPSGVRGAALRRGAGDGVLRLLAQAAARDPALPRRALRRLHVLPRRARAPQARPAAPDALLLHDLARRRARRGAGGDRRAARA